MIFEKNALIRESHWKNGLTGMRKVEKEIKLLFSQYQIPESGWSDEIIEFFLSYLGLTDSNIHIDNIGVGEREGRVQNAIIRRRCFGMTHGIGRSGDILADQPKAAGSSTLYKLLNRLILSFLRSQCNLKSLRNAIVLPLCTGMALSHIFLTLKSIRGNERKKYILISQIDQQTCLKCIIYAGLMPIVIPLQSASPENYSEQEASQRQINACFLETDIGCFERTIEHVGKDEILCIVSTSSCFSPRLPDKVEKLAKLCYELDIHHVINHAYGLQSKVACERISSAMTAESCRVDAIVCSTDKNFLVPVGGSIISSPRKGFVETLGALYPGRAGSYPIQDVLISLLSLGKKGFMNLYSEREKCLILFQSKLKRFAFEKNEYLLCHPENDVSFSITLANILSDNKRTCIGAEIFTSGATGCRVVVYDGKKKVIGPFRFSNYGSHQSTYTTDLYDMPPSVTERHAENFEGLPKIPYLTVACAIGMKEAEVHKFMKILRKVYTKYEN